MNTIITTPITNLMGALCAHENGNPFWLPREPAARLAPYTTEAVISLTDAVQAVLAEPTCLDGATLDRSNRALVFQAVKALTMAAGYRADCVLARCKLPDIGGSPEIMQEVERLRARATGREPDLETFLLGGVSNETRAEYKRLVENEAGRDERLELLMNNHRYVQDAVKASWGLIHAKSLSDFADRHGQRNSMIDPVIWTKAVTKIRILDQVTHGLLPLAKGGAA
jgi:hypothetical protein